MKRMKATISLKQLRTDPRRYVDLINSGYEVNITDHNKTIVSTTRPDYETQPQLGDIKRILQVIDGLPPIKVLDPGLDTVKAVKQGKHDYLKTKYGVSID